MRERMLSGEELARLADALADYRGSPYIAAAIKLLVFTGARLSEVLGLRWAWIDFERGEVRLPDSKTGAKTLYLPAPALAVLTELQRIEGNPHVIIGDVKGMALVNLAKPWQRIRDRATVVLWEKQPDPAVSHVVLDLKAELQRDPTARECLAAAEFCNVDMPRGLLDCRLHDLRHAFASIAASRGMGLPIIGKMLGHTQPATTQRYAHLAPDPVRAAVAAVASEIEAAMSGHNSATVVELPPNVRTGTRDPCDVCATTSMRDRDSDSLHRQVVSGPRSGSNAPTNR
jgi:integrase